MNQIQDVAQTTGPIVIVQMYAFLIIVMFIISIGKILEYFKKRRKK